MAQRYLVGQQRHDDVVKRIATGLQGKGFREIRAAVAGFDPPAPINGFVPDVTAENHQLHIYEVETETSLFEDDTARQWRVFGKYANGNGGHFVIIVPKGCRIQAEGRKNYFRIRAEVREADYPKPHQPET